MSMGDAEVTLHPPMSRQPLSGCPRCLGDSAHNVAVGELATHCAGYGAHLHQCGFGDSQPQSEILKVLWHCRQTR